MHIVFLGMYPHKDINTGGIGNFIQNLTGMLVRNGYEITVLAPSSLRKEETEIIDGVKVIRVFSRRYKYLNGVSNIIRTGLLIRRIHKKNPIDIIEAPELGFAYLNLPVQIKKVIRLHGGHHFFSTLLSQKMRTKDAHLEKISFAKADYFIGVTNYVMEYTSKLLNIEQAKRVLIHYPVDTDKFYESSLSKQIPYRIVFAGTVTEKKGIRQLILALPLVIAKFPETQLEIYGPDWKMVDGSSYTSYLHSLISPDLKKHIHFHGQVANTALPAIYESAHLCAFPSHMETQGIVVLEAMSMGKAVLFSTTGPGPETIQHLENGILVDPYSPENIAENILHLFSQPGLEEQLGKNARKRILSKYSLPVVTQLNIDFYESIVAKSKPMK